MQTQGNQSVFLKKMKFKVFLKVPCIHVSVGGKKLQNSSCQRWTLEFCVGWVNVCIIAKLHTFYLKTKYAATWCLLICCSFCFFSSRVGQTAPLVAIAIRRSPAISRIDSSGWPWPIMLNCGIISSRRFLSVSPICRNSKKSYNMKKWGQFIKKQNILLNFFFLPSDLLYALPDWYNRSK